uniref:Uncharacterized protein n=1 Tax=Arundo donax TaxID=35708 RepID=A0A0A9DSR3_ARUDO
MVCISNGLQIELLLLISNSAYFDCFLPLLLLNTPLSGKYVGNRPIKLRKSNWKERTDVEALERQKNHIQRKPKIPKKSILHK